MNAAVMFPSGKVLNERYDIGYDDREKIYLYNNVGDMFVYDSTLKILMPDKLAGFTISKSDPSNIEWINENCDYVFLRGSNYFHPFMEWPEYTIENLKKLRVPVVPIGVGVQAPSNTKPVLSKQTQEVLSILSHSCECIGVRGAFSAECMADLGIDNVQVIGCPTMFRLCNRELKIQVVKKLDSIAFTLGREVGSSYSTNTEKYLSVQGRLINKFLDRPGVRIVSQGEVDEKIIVYGKPELQEALTRINKSFGFESGTLDRYASNLEFFEDIRSYDDFIGKQDAVVGFRLHGNAMALSRGVPTVFVTYDSRTRELVEAFDMPHVDMDSCDSIEAEDLVAVLGNFSGFESRFVEMYDGFKTFLDLNGIENRL